MDNTNTCCFTGHRKLSADKIDRMIVNLDNEIDALIEKSVTAFISGDALGFDQIAASLVATKKGQGIDIRLVFALPCRNQDELWREKQKQYYNDLLGKADEIIYVSESYDTFCMKRRNQYMVQHSAYCICALLHEKSGTSQTVRLARKDGLNVINVAI